MAQEEFGTREVYGSDNMKYAAFIWLTFCISLVLISGGYYIFEFTKTDKLMATLPAISCSSCRLNIQLIQNGRWVKVVYSCDGIPPYSTFHAVKDEQG